MPNAQYLRIERVGTCGPSTPTIGEGAFTYSKRIAYISPSTLGTAYQASVSLLTFGTAAILFRCFATNARIDFRFWNRGEQRGAGNIGVFANSARSHLQAELSRMRPGDCVSALHKTFGVLFQLQSKHQLARS